MRTMKVLSQTKEVSKSTVKISLKNEFKEKKVVPETAKTNPFVKKIQKRDGEVTQFDLNKITNAIHKAMIASSEGSLQEAEMVANKVLADLVRISKKYATFVPTVEGIQDTVEKELIMSEYVGASKSYIIYREKRTELRRRGVEVPERVRELAEESKKYFGNALGEFMFYRTYAKWIEAEGRRETWMETVERFMNFMKKKAGNKFTEKEYAEMQEYILKQKTMPSMRLLQFAGPAADRCNVCAYNCSFIAPTRLRDFGEILYVSMSGTGLGFTVESQAIHQLPQIQMQTGKKIETYVVGDSKEGWAGALVHGMETWYAGKEVEFDFSLVRPAGERLKTMGGKASGPEPLRELLDYTRGKILRRQGRRLTNLDVHDIICKTGDCVLAGGVRRTALISLSDLDDTDMRHAKDGAFYYTEPQRSLANNSAIYQDKPSNLEFMEEWMALMKSGSGERGIFNRGSIPTSIPEIRRKFLEKKGIIQNGRLSGIIGVNPCGEILLQSRQFCNLTEVFVRPEDTKETLRNKIRVATMLGTFQSTLTNFGYLSKEWKENCDAERLLGVSMTGQWDNPIVADSELQKELRFEAEKVNKIYAKRFGINQSTAITCVKPSGNGSQTFNSASGLHPRHSKYYIRRVRISASDAIFKMLKDQGVPAYPEVGQSAEDAHTFVLEFPVKSPDTTKRFKDDVSAIELLEYWKSLKINFTHHNPSATISVGEDEWLEVGNWVYNNWNIVGGLSFLPRSNHVYKLAPYEEITKERYEELEKNMPELDFSKIVLYEQRDESDAKKELACAGGTCEI